MIRLNCHYISQSLVLVRWRANDRLGIALVFSFKLSLCDLVHQGETFNIRTFSWFFTEPERFELEEQRLAMGFAGDSDGGGNEVERSFN